MNKPLISVIIPVYKVEEYLDECVQSVLNQTYKNLEVILVDDGSPDRCPQMCDEYAKADNRVKVVHKQNGGLSDARNAGLEIATGDYIGFIDSDDFIERNMYEVLFNKLQSAGTEVISSKFIWFSGGEKKTYNWFNSGYSEGRVLSLWDFFHEAMKKNLDVCVPNKLFKRGIVTEKFKKKRVNEDFLFFYKLSKAHPKSEIVLTEQSFYYYRDRIDSICHDQTQLEMGVMANYDEILKDVDNKDSQLVELVEQQYIYKLYLMLTKMANDATLRNAHIADWLWVRNRFKEFENGKINQSIKCGLCGVLLLKNKPLLYEKYDWFVKKIKNIFGKLTSVSMTPSSSSI